MHSPLTLAPLVARRFVRRALLLDTPAPDIAAALAHHGHVQIDPLNVCGRMHDLILRNRVCGYREGGLHRFIHAPERPGFEHYLPHANVLAAFPRNAWPHLLARMEERRTDAKLHYGRLTREEKALARRIVAEITDRGPLTSDDISHDGNAPTAWGTQGRLVKTVLEKLFQHGELLISARRGFRRVYDLPGRVLPGLAGATARPPADETARWWVLNRLRQRRLVTLRRGEFPLVADVVVPVKIEGCPPLHCLREDLLLLEQAQEEAATPTAPLLLAPLDPLIYDRRVTAALWGFHYIWEAYTPAHQRARGYYALPVLAGTEIVGHVDPKADRPAGQLVVVSKKTRRGHALAPAIRNLAAFLGLKPAP